MLAHPDRCGRILGTDPFGQQAAEARLGRGQPEQAFKIGGVEIVAPGRIAQHDHRGPAQRCRNRGVGRAGADHRRHRQVVIVARERHRGIAVGPAGGALLAGLGPDVLLEHLLFDRMAGKEPSAVDPEQLGVRDDLGRHRVDVHHGTVLVDEDDPCLARFEGIFGNQASALAFREHHIGAYDPHEKRGQLGQHGEPIGSEVVPGFSRSHDQP